MSRLSPRLCAVVAAVVVSADLLLLWPAAAAPVQATGSWRIARQSTPVGEIPSTPLTDDGTLPVQNGPAGVLAFSALRYSLDGATGGTLTLSFAGQAPAVVPSVLACRVSGQWSPGDDQSWDKAPAYDCAQHVASSGDGVSLTWELGPALTSGDSLDIALVPDPADPTPFAVSFEAPTPGSFSPSGDSSSADVAPGTAGTGPQGSTGAGAPPAAVMPDVPTATVGAAGPATAPVVASPAPAGQPSYDASPAAAVTVPRSRAVGAGVLAAFALILLLRSFVFGGARSRAPRSLLTLQREGS